MNSELVRPGLVHLRSAHLALVQSGSAQQELGQQQLQQKGVARQEQETPASVTRQAHRVWPGRLLHELREPAQRACPDQPGAKAPHLPE